MEISSGQRAITSSVDSSYRVRCQLLFRWVEKVGRSLGKVCRLGRNSMSNKKTECDQKNYHFFVKFITSARIIFFRSSKCCMKRKHISERRSKNHIEKITVVCQSIFGELLTQFHYKPKSIFWGVTLKKILSTKKYILGGDSQKKTPVKSFCFSWFHNIPMFFQCNIFNYFRRDVKELVTFDYINLASEFPIICSN